MISKEQQELILLIFVVFSVIDFLLLVAIMAMSLRIQRNLCKELEDTERDIELTIKNSVKELELARRTYEADKKFKLKRSRIIRILKEIFFGMK